MFGHFNQAELTVVIRDKIHVYRQEADRARQLPKHSLRYRIAQQLRVWAEALEPTRGLVSQQLGRA
ncbi:hypothetical protein [Meiothermus sp.]|jgi:hypothetical protein|uniref:hypothetical protein n=1 Tax=Meiothermus sp. TaxID=1955249 RepID=UPI0021DCBFDD|nr:hypothetical protein [Meiothermus sp.]GIW24171.1 MAG: hypothetical protein KatS3mg069_0438 [Meiothermus sp.]